MDPIRNIPNVQVQNVGIYQIPSWQIRQPYVPNHYPVTNHLGFPIVDIPGCVKAHKDNKSHVNGLPIDKSLVENDPGAAMTLCPDGSYPIKNLLFLQKHIEMLLLQDSEVSYHQQIFGSHFFH